MPSASPHLPPRLVRLARLARARLFWERYAPVLAVPALALSLYIALTVLGAWEVIGDPVRLLVLAALTALIVRGGLRAARLRVPTRSDALRRLEATAGLPHRPLDTLQDQAVLAPDLWPAHVANAQDQAATIRRVGRTPALTPIDRYGLRFIAPLLLGLAIFLAWGFGLERLRQSLTPTVLSPTNPYAVTFEAWIDPPDYTGRPPIYAQGDLTLQAPVGSTLVVRASGARGLPRPRFVGPDGARFLTPERLGRNGAEVRTIIDGSGTLDWRIGPKLQRFTIDASPDAPPKIDSVKPPEADKRDRLVIVMDAVDDYGIDQVLLEMVELTDAMDEATAFDDQVSVFDTETPPFTQASNRELKLDMTRHPLAGRKIIARLVAIDGAGQRGVSEPFYTTIPDRIFVEPLAKAIIEHRGLLLVGADDYAPPPPGHPDMDASDGTFDTYQEEWRMGRAPEPVQRAALLIEAVTDRPDPSLFNDPVVYLGLRHAGQSIRYAKSAEALNGLPDHLWKLAIRAEFGVLGTALQEMQEAQQALREGIARRAPQREIDALFTRYNQAVDAYMEELRKNATVAEGGGEGGGPPPVGSVDQIQELLDAIEEANRIGDTEGARRALAQLAELLENLQLQLTPGGGGEGGESSDSEMSEEMREQLEDLAESLGEQRELQDETRQAERDELRERLGETPSGESQSPEALAQRQAEIETMIEGLQERLGDQGESAGGEEDGDQPGSQPGENGEDGRAPGEGGNEGGFQESDDADGAFGRARDAMRESEDALARGDLRGSQQAQADAIEALRDAGDSLAQQLVQEASEDGEGTDPLGRSDEAINSDNAESDLDQRDNAERSREILEELRRRAAEAERERQEQDYLERLLRRF